MIKDGNEDISDLSDDDGTNLPVFLGCDGEGTGEIGGIELEEVVNPEELVRMELEEVQVLNGSRNPSSNSLENASWQQQIDRAGEEVKALKEKNPQKKKDPQRTKAVQQLQLPAARKC
uniref:Uncharacterized protein n=1 Tax=Glossina pallidipes TaxID=7398 RepID=A0A1A9ZQY3_GLOPL